MLSPIKTQLALNIIGCLFVHLALKHVFTSEEPTFNEWMFENIVLFGSVFTAIYGIYVNGRKYIDESTRMQ
jgi:hypothetical protein